MKHPLPKFPFALAIETDIKSLHIAEHLLKDGELKYRGLNKGWEPMTPCEQCYQLGIFKKDNNESTA